MTAPGPPNPTRKARSKTDWATSSSPQCTATSAASAAGVSGSRAARCEASSSDAARVSCDSAAVGEPATES